jgi:hypothetical protein
MRKFIIYSRSVPSVEKTEDMPTIIEVEGDLLVGIPFYCLMGRRQQVDHFRIMKPDFLYEVKDIVKNGKKDKISEPPVYAMHAIIDDIIEARRQAEKLVRAILQREQRKSGVEFTEEQVLEKIREIQEVYLPNP